MPKALGGLLNIEQVVSDLTKVIGNYETAYQYALAVARYKSDDSCNIVTRQIEAFEDDDNEVYLVPKGAAEAYGLDATFMTAGKFLAALRRKYSESATYEVFVRESTKILPDGSVVSVNSPIWATGIHEQGELVYFYYGHDPKAT